MKHLHSNSEIVNKQSFRRPFGAQAANKIMLGIAVPSQSLQSSTAIYSFFDFSFQIAAPHVSGSSSFPFLRLFPD